MAQSIIMITPVADVAEREDQMHGHTQGYTCYECGGSGVTPLNPQIIKVYTPEYEAKLKAQREARAAKREELMRQEAAEKKQEWIDTHFPEGKIYVFVGSTYNIHEELKAAGAIYRSETGWHFKHPQDKYPTIEMSLEESTHESYSGFMRFNGDIYEKQKQSSMPIDQNPNG